MKHDLKISKETAHQLYKTGDESIKKILIDSFGKEEFEPANIMDRIKTFEDAWYIMAKRMGMSEPEATNQLALFHLSIHQLTKDEKAYKMLKIIINELNEEWKPDWSDSNQYKHYPWFEFVPGSGFSYNTYDHWFTHTLVGSRLCFKSLELAKYAANQFKDLYNDWLL